MKYYIEYNEELLKNVFERIDEDKSNLLKSKGKPQMIAIFRNLIKENENFLKKIIIEKE